ncbi:type B 50S ribosomal protein L31 [Chlamydiifrater phoenicopteri]|uniref:type B 50S ribosomal protein L31 n=1 Tax=Chlamydiifrater phoenicopteri TaxID=2681469 RepID=UPI001BD04C4A|nr:type B 50S ribosomal protein L31 [Chlamydiifrater phoenicopteri]
MKKNTHPEYHQVLFVDSSTGYKFVCGSTFTSEKTEIFEGKEYPVCYVSVSSSSHPFFTGSKQFIDSEGRVDKFMKRYGKGAVKPPVAASSSEAEKPVAEKKKSASGAKKAPAKKKK